MLLKENILQECNSQVSNQNQNRKPKHSPSYLLDVVIRQRAPIFELLASEDQSLLIRGDALLVLDLRFNIVNSIGRLNFKSYSLARQGLYEAII
jgi:hypothetical protein